MDILQELSFRFMKPVLEPLGFHLDHDRAFRKWSETKEICCIVELRGSNNRYSVGIGFCSPLIVTWFGLPPTNLPRLAECNLCGILFPLDTLLKINLQMGWLIANEKELETVGHMFGSTLEAHLPRLLDKYMDIIGWITHFREILGKQSAGRGIPWSKLGFALLGSKNCTLEEILQVISSHSQEDISAKSANRIDKHLERQRSLVFERFGVHPT